MVYQEVNDLLGADKRITEESVNIQHSSTVCFAQMFTAKAKVIGVGGERHMITQQ